MSNYDLFYVWGGEGELLLNDQPYQVKGGSCFLFRPGDYTSATHNPQKPLTLTYIHFNLSAGDEPEHKPDSYHCLQEKVIFETLLSQYVRLRLSAPYGGEEESQLLLKQMMIHLLREGQNDVKQSQQGSYKLSETIREIANFIRQHAAKSYSIEDLAVRANLSPRYFSFKFKEIMGQSVQSYLIIARIERAEHLLHYAGMSVTEVADALGYRDVFFFSRQFKQYTGKSPSEIR
ncbi:HTH-type transcriptional activator Btr [compost metagenome]